MALRPDLQIISEWITPGSRILDLGCGDGTLLQYLRDTRNGNGYGIEIDDDNVLQCIKVGVNVIQTDLDAGLSEFDADSFPTRVEVRSVVACLVAECSSSSSSQTSEPLP